MNLLINQMARWIIDHPKMAILKKSKFVESFWSHSKKPCHIHSCLDEENSFDDEINDHIKDNEHNQIFAHMIKC